ncbi:TonB-dependent receptor [Membranihabitans maritimus]|uniref:TonB-dependent receptor n=1 Tax=Membranihabitans maritimus TaxID=2904244 RepID=UPI001F2706DE|nr:TonB-dependent receptor [Membranihabitans maritimus]
MKLSILAFFSTFFVIQANTGYSQKMKISLNLNDATVERLLEQIESHSEFRFVYKIKDVDLTRTVSVRVENEFIDEILNQVFADTHTGYEIIDRQIFLVAKKRVHREKKIDFLNRGDRFQRFAKIVPDTLSGIIKDVSGEPLIGVNIRVKGTNKGSATDFEGRFGMVDVEDDAILVVSYIGYRTLEVPVGGQKFITVFLQSDVETLDELVVVGYSAKKQSELSSAVNVISNKDLMDVTSNSVSSMLQGKAPGLVVSNGSGDPTATSSINIRGSSSISANSNPLIVVDGIIGGSVNPSDVESVTVLKDAAATGLYGSRAANGVIIITTKSGQAGKTTIRVNSSVGFNHATGGNFEVMNTAQLYAYEQSFYPADRFAEEIPSSVLSQHTDWLDLAFRKGLTQNYVATVSGGSEKTQFYVSGNFYSEEGTLQKNFNDKYNLRSNITHQMNEKMSLDLRINAAYIEQEREPSGLNGALYGAYLNIPWDNPYSEDGQLRRGTEGNWFGREQENFLHGWQYNFNSSNGLNLNGDLNYRYSILQNLEFSSYNRVSFSDLSTQIYEDIRSKAGKGNGRLREESGFSRGLITSNRLRYFRSVGQNDFTVLGVLEGEKNYSENGSIQVDGLAPGLHVLDAASTVLNSGGNVYENAFRKALTQVDYSFSSKYFLVGAFINESSSRFGSNNRSANFFTLGTSWILSNESFMSNQSLFDFLKLRVSYGITGNANIGNYQSLGLYSYSTQYAGNSGSIPSQIPNQDLTWEKVKTFNVGVDMDIIKRISVNLDFYRKESDGLLLNVELPFTSGFSSVTRNIGSILNKGIELNILSKNIDREIKWTTNFNIAFNKSEVLELNEDNNIIQGNQIVEEGEELYTWYMRKWAGVDPQNGDPLWEVVNENGSTSTTNVYSEGTLQKAGDANPDFTGGIINTFTYKNVSLSGFFNFTYGNLVYHSSRALFDSDGAYYTFNNMVLADGWSRWEQAGDNATHPKPVFGGNKNSNQTSSRYLEDGSYIRLRNITLTYRLPQEITRRAGLADLNFFVSGDNLVTLTDFSGMDPEVALGAGGSSSSLKYPISKKILFGINITL